ncbi:hypothetical protein Tco_1023483 [Tanacetum coccineum]
MNSSSSFLIRIPFSHLVPRFDFVARLVQFWPNGYRLVPATPLEITIVIYRRLLTWRHMEFDSSTPTKEGSGSDFVLPNSIPQGLFGIYRTCELTFTQLTGNESGDNQVNDLPHIRFIDLNDNELDGGPEFNLNLDLNVPQNEMQENVVVFEVPNDRVVNESETHVDVETAFVEPRSEELIEQGIEQGIDQQVQYHVMGDKIGSAYDTQYDEPAVEVNLFDFTGNEAFDNIGVTNQLPDVFSQGDGVEVVNVNGLIVQHVLRMNQRFGNATKVNDIVHLHAIETRRNLKLIKNDGWRIRAIRVKQLPVFIESQCNGPTRPSEAVSVGPCGSSGLVTKSKIGRVQIFDQVKVNLEIPTKAVQDQLQPDLKLQVSMSKVFRVKAKAEREISSDHTLQYAMVRDYFGELPSTNPNTIVKIAVDKDTDPFLPTRVFKRLYVCLGAFKYEFRACRREVLGLDSAFIKGSFLGQVLAAVGIDLNNRIYPLAYALVKAKSKSS